MPFVRCWRSLWTTLPLTNVSQSANWLATACRSVMHLPTFGFTLPDSATDCVDDAGRLLLVQATIDGELPEQQTLFGAISPCLAGG